MFSDDVKLMAQTIWSKLNMAVLMPEDFPAVLLSEMKPEIDKYKEALHWCSGSSDFGPDGQARTGWLRICEPLLNSDIVPHSWTANNTPIYAEDDLRLDLNFNKNGVPVIKAFVRNNDRYTNKEPIDISMEEYRTYVYANGDTYTIQNPKQLYIRDSGGHRVVDDKEAHIIASGWKSIRIPKENLRF